MYINKRDTGINDCQSIVFNNLVLPRSLEESLDANAIVSAIPAGRGGISQCIRIESRLGIIKSIP